MEAKKLDYELPGELIAQKPADERSKSRLLVFNRAGEQLTDSVFERIGDFLRAGDCLVLNDTKVLPARFFARRASGAKLEGLFLAGSTDGLWRVMLKNSRKVKQGERIFLIDHKGEDFCTAVAKSRAEGGEWFLEIEDPFGTEKVLEKTGYAPLPPYIKRTAGDSRTASDTERYQTIYARYPGAVAAPTAGLHFTDGLIGQLKEKGVLFAYLTLHVGAGTFKPVKSRTLEEHNIHSENYRLDGENAEIINSALAKNSRIIAVGTTSVRTLETVAEGRKVNAGSGATKLFIVPGYKFKIVDAMITNFHLPRSTLLALAAAFTGLENILNTYQYAIENHYRFYSYGDAMLII